MTFNKFAILPMILALFACDQSTTTAHEKRHVSGDTVVETIANPMETLIQFGELFTQTDAEKILGESAHLTDSSMANKADTLEYKSTYTADSEDPKTGKRGNIYFMIEQYQSDESAHDSYTFFKEANEKNGIKILYDMGDEAYYHSDNQNFYFILVRKGTKMVRLKVNKITGNTSLSELNEVARKITREL